MKMNNWYANSFRGQFKIQQMAFVLLAIMLFFGMVALGYFAVRMNDLHKDAKALKEEEAKALVKKLAGSPEFRWRECEGCIDFDKALILKEREAFKGFWNLDYLRIDVLYPAKKGECTKKNYPDCKTLVVVNKSSEFGIPASSFVSLCRKEFEGGTSYDKCVLGRIYASGEKLQND